MSLSSAVQALILLYTSAILEFRGGFNGLDLPELSGDVFKIVPKYYKYLLSFLYTS